MTDLHVLNMVIRLTALLRKLALTVIDMLKLSLAAMKPS